MVARSMDWRAFTPMARDFLMVARFGAFHGLARLEAFHGTPLRLAGAGYRRRRYAPRIGLCPAGIRPLAARYLPVAGTCHDTCPQANTRA